MNLIYKLKKQVFLNHFSKSSRSVLLGPLSDSFKKNYSIFTFNQPRYNNKGGPYLILYNTCKHSKILWKKKDPPISKIKIYLKL